MTLETLICHSLYLSLEFYKMGACPNFFHEHHLEYIYLE